MDWAERFDIPPLTRNTRITAKAVSPILLPMDWSPFLMVAIKRLAADYRNGDQLCQTNDGVIWSVVRCVKSIKQRAWSME
jgi:hypothetical protein